MHGRMKFLMRALSAMIVLTSPAAMASGDLELGRYLATECLTCHRNSGGSSIIPNIVGLDRGHIVTSLRAYRAEELPNPVMRSVAKRLTDDEIDAISAYIASIKSPAKSKQR